MNRPRTPDDAIRDPRPDPVAALGTLDPSRDAIGWEARIQTILAAAGPELTRRRLAVATAAGPMSGSDPLGILDLLAGWLRPALSAAAALAAAALATLLLSTPPSAADTSPGIAEALGYPQPVASWLETGVMPSVEELVLTLDARSGTAGEGVR